MDRVPLCNLISLRFNMDHLNFLRTSAHVTLKWFDSVNIVFWMTILSLGEGILEVPAPFFWSRSLSSLKKMRFMEKMKSCLGGRRVELLVWNPGSSLPDARPALGSACLSPQPVDSLCLCVQVPQDPARKSPALPGQLWPLPHQSSGPRRWL